MSTKQAKAKKIENPETDTLDKIEPEPEDSLKDATVNIEDK